MLEKPIKLLKLELASEETNKRVRSNHVEFYQLINFYREKQSKS